jgi:signal transduction histidine kinase
MLTLEILPSDVTVFGDADRILTIISNLLENAIKYSPHGGTIQCIVTSSNHLASLSIVDHGVGIASDDLPRLFNRFERIEHRDTSHVGGTGLGLYLSRELARQHGGDIHVKSSPQAGSTFTLTLPLALPTPEATEVDRIEPQLVTPHLHVVADAETESRLA